MSNFVLKLEAKICCDISDAALEAVLIANKFDIDVEFDFNGKLIYVAKGTSATSLLDKYYKKEVNL